MRKLVWTIHSWLGLIAGLGLLIIGLTGSLLVFRDELDGLVAADATCVEPGARDRLSWDALYAAARRAWPEHAITGFGPRRSPQMSDVFYLRAAGDHGDRVGTLDPYTGSALCSPLNPARTLTGILLELHYTWFAAHFGILATGIFGVLLCVLGVTGVWIYRSFWKSFFTLRWKRSARIFFSDLHKMVGISSVGFNLILGFTGAYWNITHVAAEGLFERETDTSGAEPHPLGPGISLDAMSRIATDRMPGFEVRWISFPARGGDAITLWGTTTPGSALGGGYGSSAAFDPQTGALQSVVDLRRAGGWPKIVDTFSSLHFGTFGGLPVKVLWCGLGLAPGVLAASGFLVWRRRRRPRRRDA